MSNVMVVTSLEVVDGAVIKNVFVSLEKELFNNGARIVDCVNPKQGQVPDMVNIQALQAEVIKYAIKDEDSMIKAMKKESSNDEERKIYFVGDYAAGCLPLKYIAKFEYAIQEIG